MKTMNIFYYTRLVYTRILASSCMICMLGAITLLSACSDGIEPMLDEPADHWIMSRNESGASSTIRMLGKHKSGNGDSFNKTISFTGGQSQGTWQDGTPPVWHDGATYDLVAYYPADKEWPSDDIFGTGNIFQLDYWKDCYKDDKTDTRPTSFDMKYLHGQLKVHIDIHELDTEEHQPMEVKIRLRQKGRVNYTDRKLEPIGDFEEVTLTGWKHDQWEVGTSHEEVDHKWVMADAITVIPQHLVQDGLPVVTFHIEDSKYGTAKYEFIPNQTLGMAMELEAGKCTHLYLGVSYIHDEEVEAVIELDGITVSPWEVGETIDGGEAVEQ